LKSPAQVHDVDLQSGTKMGVLLNNDVNASQAGSAGTRYHQSNRNTGTKYYTYNGQNYAMDVATGERYPVSSHTAATTSQAGKYYTYQGHPYFLNSATGVRSQLD